MKMRPTASGETAPKRWRHTSRAVCLRALMVMLVVALIGPFGAAHATLQSVIPTLDAGIGDAIAGEVSGQQEAPDKNGQQSPAKALPHTHCAVCPGAHTLPPPAAHPSFVHFTAQVTYHVTDSGGASKHSPPPLQEPPRL